MDSPNKNIPGAAQLLPVIVVRGAKIEQFQADLNKAVFAGYEPEPGLMCPKGNEIWVVCMLREGDDPPDSGDDHRPEPPDNKPPAQPAAGNINEAAAAKED